MHLVVRCASGKLIVFTRWQATTDSVPQFQQTLSVKHAGLDIGAACWRNDEKKRNFVESIELQIALKTYDPQKDKRFPRNCEVRSNTRFFFFFFYFPRPQAHQCPPGHTCIHWSYQTNRAQIISIDDLNKWFFSSFKKFHDWQQEMLKRNKKLTKLA